MRRKALDELHLSLILGKSKVYVGDFHVSTYKRRKSVTQILFLFSFVAFRFHEGPQISLIHENKQRLNIW